MGKFLRDVPTSVGFWWVAINFAHLSLMLILVAGDEVLVPATFLGVVAYVLGWIGQDCDQAERDAQWLSRVLEEGDDGARRNEMRRERREMFASIGLGTDKDPFKDVDVLAGEEE